MTDEAIINGYGDIYIQLKQKMKKNEFIEKNIKTILLQNNYIVAMDIYGIEHSLLISGDRNIPVYLLSFLQLESKPFLNEKDPLKSKHSFYCGEVLYKRYNFLEKKKLAMITGENSKKKILFFQAMPIHFYKGSNFGWDDWNEKIIMMPVENVENYFEIPTIEFIHIYIDKKEKINEVYLWIANILKKDIAYINLGYKVLPEYNKFLVLLTIISHGVLFLIFVFSYFLLLILINLYMYQNAIEFHFLRMVGIKNFYIMYSLLLFFGLLGCFSLLGGFVAGYSIISLLNFFKCIVISIELNSYFFCVVNLKTIFFYAIGYIILLILSVFYYYRKYVYSFK